MGRGHAEIVAVVLETLAHLDDVAVSLRGEHAHLGAFALEERIGRHGGPVHDEIGGPEQRGGVGAEIAAEDRDAVHHPDGRILGSGRRLGDGHPALRIHRHEIGEGAAHVDADAIHVSGLCVRARARHGRSSW